MKQNEVQVNIDFAYEISTKIPKVTLCNVKDGGCKKKV